MLALLSRIEIAVIIGVLGAIALVRIARSLAPRRELLVYGVGLGITAVAYFVFALQRSAPASHLGLELIGAGLYGIAAVLGTRRWPALLAVGWTAHVAWDLFFHYASGLAFAPAWYPWFCVGFDLFLGG
jgi:hypothetical protein